MPCVQAVHWGHHLVSLYKTCCKRERKYSHENSIDHCWKRFQRRRRYPGGYEDHDGQRRLRHERRHAQNTTGVTDILESTPHFLGEQLDAIFADIFPDAVKIGMVSSADLIVVIAEKLKQYKAENIVVDPVMVATSGAKLLRDDAVEALCRELLPLAAVLTPNIPEAEILSGMTITDATGMEAAAKYISEKYGCAVLCKGGHKVNDADDLLWRNGFGKWFHGKRIDNPNTHGTGCTLSSAIASNLAKGYDLDESVERAKEYISGALAAMLDLGHGSGPMNHMFALKGAFTE